VICNKVYTKYIPHDILSDPDVHIDTATQFTGLHTVYYKYAAQSMIQRYQFTIDTISLGLSQNYM